MDKYLFDKVNNDINEIANFYETNKINKNKLMKELYKHFECLRGRVDKIHNKFWEDIGSEFYPADYINIMHYIHMFYNFLSEKEIKKMLTELIIEFEEYGNIKIKILKFIDEYLPELSNSYQMLVRLSK